ncbi:MAG: hypothetical protein F7C07_07440 [Desulfurococcales archaeon]|nr:hypothetical protein [Desulfurococcales archaeon]
MQGSMEPVTITVSSSIFDSTAVRIALKAAEILRNEYGITALVDIETSPTPFRLIEAFTEARGMILIGNKALVLEENTLGYEATNIINEIIDTVLEHLALEEAQARARKSYFSPSNDGEGVSGEYVIDSIKTEDSDRTTVQFIS